MADQSAVNENSTANPCCNELRERYLKLQQKYKKMDEGRAALRKGIEIYARQVSIVTDENTKLKKDCEEEKLQTENERKEKERESVARASLENEISSLKSALSQRGESEVQHVGEEIALRVFESEKEIKRLQEELQKTISVADAERKKTVEEKKRADEAWESAKTERSRADEELSQLKLMLHSVETEKNQLKKNLHKERERADLEKKRADEALNAAETEKSRAELLKADKESAEKAREMESNLLEDELSSLKSQNLLLRQKGNSGDQSMDVVKTLQGRISEMEAEISRLKIHLDKERIRADAETKNAETEKKKAKETLELLKAENSTADEQRRLVDAERKKAEENAHRLEGLRLEANEARSKLVFETSKSKEANRKLEAERQKVKKEKKKASEQQKIAEMSTKHALEEKSRADCLYQQLEDNRQKYNKLKKEMEEIVSSRRVVEAAVSVPGKRLHLTETEGGNQGEVVRDKADETNSGKSSQNLAQVKQKPIGGRSWGDLDMKKAAEQKKAAEMYKLQALKERSRADELAQQLEDTRRRIKDSSKNVQDLVLSTNSTVPSGKDVKANFTEVKLLKKELKLEKKRVKHAKQVAELEKDRKRILEEELHRLKLEFTLFSKRIGLYSCSADCSVGKSPVEKNDNISSRRKFTEPEAYPLHLLSGKELLKPNVAATNASEHFKQSLDCTAPSFPVSGNYTESTSGTASKMEPLLGGSNRKVLDNTAIDSSMASFSDKQLVSSQGRCGLTNSESAERPKENLDISLPVSHLSGEVGRCCNENIAMLVDRSPLKVRSKERRIKKRKRLLDAIESIEHLYCEGNKWHAKVAEKISNLHGILGQTDKLPDGMHFYDQCHKKRKVQIEEVPMVPCNSHEQKEQPVKNLVGDANMNFLDMEIFDRMSEGDFMKLLNLDDEVEEEHYRAAVERPLSPSLPEIQFESRPPNDIWHSSQVQDSDGELGISNSGDRGSKDSCGNCFRDAHDDPCQLIVVFPDASENSIFRICRTTRSFKYQGSTFSETGNTIRNLLTDLSTVQDLLPKEKSCVFFSVVLNSFSGVALMNFNSVYGRNFLNSVDIFYGQMREVMSDLEIQSVFAEACDLEELITLIENFIIDGRVLVHANIVSETLVSSDPKYKFQKASMHQLVFGAILLASVCAVFDRFDFICETSYAICRRKITVSLMLTFLHVFAYICGEKLFALDESSLIMIATKSLVILCERENMSSDFPSCAKCPFSEGAVSMEELTSLLLERLRSYALCNICKGGGIACCMHRFGELTYKSKTVPDGTLCILGDVLSLLELVASSMSWSWTCDNIVGQLLKLLEGCVMETSLTAILVLLGQIARLGIDANGLQDAEVDNMRIKLCSFLSQITSSKLGLSVQFAAVNALLVMIPLNFQELAKSSEELPAVVSPSTPADCIRKWYSLLNSEHKSLSLTLLTAGVH